MKGVYIGGMNINNLRYADDTVLLAEGPTFMQASLTAVNEKGKPYGMEMNIIKSKLIMISRKKPVPNISISVEGKPIQQKWYTLVTWQQKMENMTKSLKEE